MSYFDIVLLQLFVYALTIWTCLNRFNYEKGDLLYSTGPRGNMR